MTPGYTPASAPAPLFLSLCKLFGVELCTLIGLVCCAVATRLARLKQLLARKLAAAKHHSDANAEA